MAENRVEQALREIVGIAQGVVGDRPSSDRGDGHSGTDDTPGCRIMALPARLQEQAAGLASRVNPANAPFLELPGVDAPQRATLYTSKYWGPTPKQFTVSFMESTPADLRARIVSHLNAWAESCGITFAETAGTGLVRISREAGGYWSYLGTDVKLIPTGRPTMNLQAFTMHTSEAEYRRVVRHEAGHTLGFPHEHMRKALVDRIDPEKAYEYFQRTQGWDRQTVDQQVLTPLGANTVIGTEPDQDSIMCYQLPGSITRDGQPIRGGADINQTDAAFAGVIYPKVLRSADDGQLRDAVATVPAPRAPSVPDWDPQDDVLAAAD